MGEGKGVRERAWGRGRKRERDRRKEREAEERERRRRVCDSCVDMESRAITACFVRNAERISQTPLCPLLSAPTWCTQVTTLNSCPRYPLPFLLKKRH